MDKYVTNIFWSNGTACIGKIYILYSDMTYEIIRTKYSPTDWRKRWNIDKKSYKQFLDLKVLSLKKFTPEQVHEYIERKTKEYEES